MRARVADMSRRSLRLHQTGETSATVTDWAPMPSRYAAEDHLSHLREALTAVRHGSKAEMDHVVWPAGLNRSLLPRLRLAVRTRNALGGSGLMEGDGPLTVQDVLRLQNFGQTSLRDLLFTLEAFLNQCIRNGPTDSDQHGHRPHETSPPPPGASRSQLEHPPSSWERTGRLLAPLLAAGAELYGTKSLVSALHPDFVRLASRMGISSDLEAVRVLDLVDGTNGLASVVSDRLALLVQDASVAQRTVLEHRILGSPPKTLEEVGLIVGVTRERIRQIQKRLEWKVRNALGKELEILASVAKERFGSLAVETEFEDRIKDLLPAEPPSAKRLFRQALIAEMGYSLEDGVFFDSHVARIVEHLASVAQTRADDVGLVEEEQLIAEVPREWRQSWPWLRDRCGLHDMYGSLGIRASTKARAKAALISIARPATRNEIGRVCGLDETRVGATLSNVPSVVRSSKDQWGLREWVDDEYDGIVGEIVQRIEEDGGSTTTERLLTELPAKFGVNPMSVRAYMQTPKFVIRDGSISLASSSSVQLRHLDDVIDGRDRAGNPFWTFVVEARYLEGYSVTGVSPEFAKALGCEADSAQRVRIENLAECRELSVGWRLASTTGASLGYVAEPLKQLGLEPGQRARVTIKGSCLVNLSADDGGAEESRGSEADAILERMMQRRKVL